MALKAQDVITEDFVRDTVEELVEADLVYREVFDQINATSIQSNAYQFNIAEDNMGRVRMVPEGAEIPRHQNTVDTVTVNFDKFAGEIALTMESQEDGLLDMKAREVEDLGRAMDEVLNYEAYQELENNISRTVGDNNDSFSFADIRDGIIAVRENDYSPDTMILDLQAYGDLLTDSNFNRATASGDQVVATGEIGEIAGLNVLIDNTQSIGTDNSGNEIDGTGHGAYLIDTDRFGYELSRTPMGTNSYEDPERMAEVVQAYTRRSWKALFPKAAVKIDG